MKMEKLLKRFRVDKPDKFRLADYDPADTCGLDIEKAEAKAMLADGIERLAELQERLYAKNRWSVLAVFQAMDAAGKDGAIKHVMSGVNPQGCQVHSFKAPSAGGARSRFPLAHRQGACRSAGASASSTARTTRKCWWCACIRNCSRASVCPSS